MSVPSHLITLRLITLRHNERDGLTNHRRLHRLLNCLLRCRSKKTSKLRVTGLCEGNPPVTYWWNFKINFRKGWAPIWWAVEIWSQNLLNIIFQAGHLIFLMSHYFLFFSLWNMFGDPLTINPTGPIGPLHICKQNHWTMWTKRNSFAWDFNVMKARWVRSMWNTGIAWSYVSNTLERLLGSSLHSTCLLSWYCYWY